MRKYQLVALLLLLLPLGVQAQTATVFRNARVFDGATVLPGTDVLVVNGLITRLGKSLNAPAGAQIIDATDKTLLPGLIDAHTHAFTVAALREAAVFGVTTELDMFTEPSFAKEMRAQQRTGAAHDRADLFSAGVLVTTPGGHGTEYGVPIPTITTPDSAQAFVDARIAEGSDYIKLVYDDGALFQARWTTLSEPTMRAVIAAAHKRGKLAVVHVSTARAAQAAIDADADGLVHLFVDTLAAPRFVATMKRERAFAIPTLVVLKSIAGTGGGAPLVRDARLLPYLNTMTRAALTTGFPNRPGAPRKDYEFARASVQKLQQAGVDILAGTDAPNPGTAHGAAMHRELELLVEAGLTPLQALAAATVVPARVFSLKGRGRIAPGMRADLLLVHGDPTIDITATRAIAGVWKGGHAIDRVAFANAVAADLARAQSAPNALVTGVISDFEDNTAGARFGTVWNGSTDKFAGGTSTGSFKVIDGGANHTAKALQITGSINPGFAFPWSGVMWSPGAQPMTPADLSSKKEIRFWSKGDGGTYRIMIFAQSKGMTPVDQSFVAGPEWREQVFPWSTFGLDGKGIMAIIFTGGPKAGDFMFQVDEVVIK
jgi:imidazolonepropionase-like amidohydrolase